MLINCPRCGFSQPQDQYCAQCGVDMQTFKPKARAWYVRFFGNPTVQVAALLIAAALVGQNIIRSQQPQSWVQKITRFQGVTATESAGRGQMDNADAEDGITAGAAANEPVSETSSASQAAEPLDRLRNQEIDLAEARDGNLQAGGPASADETSLLPSGEPAAMTFKLTYAEVSYDTLQRWINDSSAAGLYQNLSEYSAGILPDFAARGDSFKEVLKTASLRIPLSGTNSNISGTMNDEGSQLIGLITAVEFRTTGRDLIHGNISVTRNNGQGGETYPAEFHLPRRAAFFLLGALKRDSLGTERDRLNMPPFQIFKSPDFMTRKTEFVIVLEPEYK